MNKKIRISKINELTSLLEEFFLLATDNTSLTFDDIYTTQNKPTKDDVGLGSLPNSKSSVLDSSDEEVLATVNGLKKLKDLIDAIETHLSNSDESLATHNHDLAYLGILAKAADSDKLDGIDSSYFIFGDTDKGKINWFSKSVLDIVKCGFYSTDGTTTGLPENVSAIGTLLALNCEESAKTLIYSPDNANELYIYKTDKAWEHIIVGSKLENIIYGSDASGTMKIIDSSCSLITKTGIYSMKKNTGTIDTPSEMNGIIQHIEGESGNAIQRFTESNTLNEYVRIKINSIWNQWNLILAKSTGNETLITQNSHGFSTSTPVFFNGTLFEKTNLSQRKTCDGIAIPMDENKFYLLSAGTFEIKSDFKDSSGSNFENGEFYFLDQTSVGGLTKEQTSLGIRQLIFKVIYSNGKQYALVNITEPEEVLEYDAEETSTIISSLTEANNIRISGVYTFNSVETPTNTKGYIQHIQSSLNGQDSVQTFYPYGDDFRVYTRKLLSGTWSQWKQISVEISADGLADQLNQMNSDILTLKTDVGNTASLNTQTKVLTQAINEILLKYSNVDNTNDLSKPISQDTQNALNLKADDSSTVHTGGNEEISGVKTFTTEIVNNGGLSEKITTTTSSLTLTSLHNIILCNSASAMTITLPQATTNTNRQYKIKNINTGVVTVDTNASETIDGQLTTSINNKYDAITLICDGTQWFII